MMKHELELKLQGCLDAELPEAEARSVQQQLETDAEAQSLFAELRTTRSILRGSEELLKLPESREFFWSKIERQIARETQAARNESQPAGWLASWRRFMAPASAIAALVIALLVTLDHQGITSRAPESESAFADPGTFTYRDYKSRTTLVWVSYPATEEYSY